MLLGYLCFVRAPVRRLLIGLVGLAVVTMMSAPMVPPVALAVDERVIADMTVWATPAFPGRPVPPSTTCIDIPAGTLIVSASIVDGLTEQPVEFKLYGLMGDPDLAGIGGITIAVARAPTTILRTVNGIGPYCFSLTNNGVMPDGSNNADRGWYLQKVALRITSQPLTTAP